MSQELGPGRFDGVLVTQAVASRAGGFDQVPVDQAVQFGHFQAGTLDNVRQIATFLRGFGSSFNSISNIVENYPEVGYLVGNFNDMFLL